MTDRARVQDVDVDVAVLGSGPAGTAAAIALARLGWRVRQFGGRPRAALEGISPRVLGLLDSQHLSSTRAAVGPRLPRSCAWAGAFREAGDEFLVDRETFDRALGADAERAGVERDGRPVLDRRRLDDGTWNVRVDDGPCRARAVVDARGRRAGRPAILATPLLAVTQRHHAPAAPAGTTVSMGRDAWYWVISDGCGRLQLLAVGSPLDRTAGETRARRLLAPASMPPLVTALLRDATPVSAPRSCAATMRMRPPAEDVGCVLAGDASIAIDPLSGHGIYESLASTPAVAAAIHTWLTTNEWQASRTFLNERAEEMWTRKLRAAATFYVDAAAAQPDAFWTRTAARYGSLAAAMSAAAPSRAQVALRPVLNGPRIELRRVVIGPRWPRGVWRHGDIDLAVLLERGAAHEWNPIGVADSFGSARTRAVQALDWLRAQELWPAPCGAPARQSSERNSLRSLT